MSFAKLPILRHGLMIRHEEILPGQAVTDRLNKIRSLMKDCDVRSLLVYGNPAANGPVCYLTGYPCFALNRAAVAVLGRDDGLFLYTTEPSRNIPKVRQFTTCDLEAKKQVMPAACKQANILAEGGLIGLVGSGSLPNDLQKTLEEELDLSKIKDLSSDFNKIMTAKDGSSLKAVRLAEKFAAEGMEIFREQAALGEELLQAQAYTDYQLRLRGCEDVNILLGCGSENRLRPGLPDRAQQLSAGNKVVVLVAAQYARHWGIAGRTLAVGDNGVRYSDRLGDLEEIQNKLAAEISPGMSIQQVEIIIKELGKKGELSFASDLPLVSGVGFDIQEYPVNAEDTLQPNTVLQIVLTVDSDENSTDMLIDMLRITENGGVWLKSERR